MLQHLIRPLSHWVCAWMLGHMGRHLKWDLAMQDWMVAQEGMMTHGLTSMSPCQSGTHLPMRCTARLPKSIWLLITDGWNSYRTVAQQLIQMLCQLHVLCLAAQNRQMLTL